MRVVGLISGGKDSIYNLLQCIAAGHEVMAVANIEPFNKEELDSYMYQSVGHEVISLIAASLGLPIFRQTTRGSAVCKDKTYKVSEKDEVEDLHLLLLKVKKKIPIEGVAVGAIASDYQRTRVENVCERLGLKCFAYLWKRDQRELLEEMIHCGLDAIIIKVASIGLKPDFHLGAHIREVKNNLFELNKKFGVNICGEGGEYETLTLDCPLFTKVIKIMEYDNIVLSNDAFAPVGILNVKNAVLKSKTIEKKDPVFSQLARLNYIQNNIANPLFYVQDCLGEMNESIIAKEHNLKSTDRFGVVEADSSMSNTGAQRMLHFSRSKLSQKMHSTMDISPVDTTNCSLNYSTGWYFIGNTTGATLAQNLAFVQRHLSRFNFDFADIVMVELFVRDMAEFTSINSVYSQFMPKTSPPVRVCVEACLPLDVGVLTNVIAQKCISRIQKALTACLSPEKDVMHVQSISHWAPANIGPYSQCIRVGSVYYIAGQIPLIPGNMEIFNESTFSQCKLTLRHVLRILQAMNPMLTYSNILQAICYVTSEPVTSEVVPMWSYITDNNAATVTSIFVTQLPRKAELEWQVIACDSGEPKENEKSETIGDYKVYMKRCVFRECLTSSLVCKIGQVRKKHRQKSEVNLKLETTEDLVFILKDAIKFLIANLQCAGVPLCMLKLFHKLDDATVTNLINEITKSTENCKVTASGIPVLGCESSDVFLTVTGVCH